ncbi:HTH-type transcriptional repressor YtrA [Polystyrenella longa]|uniref:HTH-type transcriptional repressor YtrA n=1 Tax=Polystyrenella longa TaxID=2528007 RepID=A0A518CSR7_9PLAN|nr:GntR family transcriptional regulator [Polystyrenella longa]QDU82273.1 HTH-type transcriptional repressor YtrA [Polystyrenella longa]
MFLRIEKGSAVPISRQISSQITALCLSEQLQPGDKLPSVRELARELTVNQNTILRVYEKLTAEGILDKRHGAGTFVADSPPLRQLKEQRELFFDEWQQLVRQGLSLGLTKAELKKMLSAALANDDTPVSSSS